MELHRTPAARHLAAKMARLSAAASSAGEKMEGTAYQLQLAQLAEHRRMLKAIQSVEAKIRLKAKLLPIYDPWVDGVLAAGQGAQDMVLTTVMVWHIDAGNYARAWQIAQYVLKHNLDMPDQYERNLPTILQEEFADAYLAGKMPAEAATADLLTQVLEATQARDTFDQVKAKLCKAVAFALLGKVTPSADVDYTQLGVETCAAALEHLKRALSLFEQVGVKKDIERLDRYLKKLTTIPTDTAPATAPDTPPAPAQADNAAPTSGSA